MRRSMLVFVCCLIAVFTGLILFGYAEAAPGRGKSAAKDLLPVALKNIDIKDDFVPGAGKEAGVIQTITGHAVVARQDLRQAYFAAVGDRLYEKDVLFTLKDSRCRFRMHNEDVVTLGESTRLGITAFVDDRNTQEKRSSFGMTKGKAMFYTLRLLKHKQAGMDVTTPTAVAGVRGTKFGVDVVEIDESTNVYAFEGGVTVTATATGQTTTLTEGRGVNASIVGLGGTFVTPPGVSRQFQSDTLVQGGGGGSAAASGTIDSTVTTDTTDTTGSQTPPDTASLTQQQNLATYTETPHIEHWMTSVFVNGTVNGHEVIDGVVYGPEGFESNRPIPAIPPSDRTIVGSNAYMEWGYWSSYAYFDPNPPSTGTTYYVGNFTRTTDSQIAALAAGGIVGTYTGTAIGGHTYGGVVTQMTGTFNATINFATAAVTNFNINVSGTGGTSAYISGASGQLGNSGYPGIFTVSGGSVGVSGSTSVPRWNANGAVVGTNGQAVAGDWWLEGNLTRAGGVFQGTR